MCYHEGMETTVAPTLSLKQLREARGLSTRQAAQLVADALGESKRTHASIIKIEREGTNLDTVAEALALVYNVDVAAVRAASKKLRNAGKN